MALESKLTRTREKAAPETPWPRQPPEWANVRASLLIRGDRRFDAETFLSDGYAIRVAIESKSRWQPLGDLSAVWQPSRLRGIQVSEAFGTPFLAATQVFDMHPVPRKWLALSRTDNPEQRFVSEGTILVTCSGSVGRATLAFAPHLDVLISHDLMRVAPHESRTWGWIYACLRAPKIRSVMRAAKYGHIIKHLEISHLSSTPIPQVDVDTLESFNESVSKIINLRNRAHQASLEAERLFEVAVAGVQDGKSASPGFVMASSRLAAGRRRLDAAFHQPLIRAIYDHLGRNGRGFVTLQDAGFEMWLPTRFRRIPAVEGVDLVDSSSLFEINPDIGRHIADGDFGDRNRGRVAPGWLLLARSGQVYGILGTFALATEAIDGKVISDDVIRIAGDKKTVRAGYVLTALSHPSLGRPIVKAIAYGSSVPHIDVGDVCSLRVVRLAAAEEDQIADLAELSAEYQGRADVLERQVASDAESIINRFIASR